MTKTISPQKINDLLSPVKMRKLLEDNLLEKISEIKILPIKEYRDKRSFSLVVVYIINKKKKITGLANSDNKKEYAFKINKFLADKSAVPKPYYYFKSHGLMLREYLPGKTLEKKIERKTLSLDTALKITEWLKIFQKIKPPSFIKKGVNFYNMENNIKILKKRKIKEAKIIEKNFREIKREIKKKERKNQKPVMVHGDFNPFNLILNNKKITVIDLENVHLGDRIIDIANFCSHLYTLAELKITEKEKKLSEKNFLKASGFFSLSEKKGFEVYKKYFNLLAISHQMVWGNFKTAKNSYNSTFRKKFLPVGKNKRYKQSPR